MVNKRLPRITQRKVSSSASVQGRIVATAIELPCVETFPGAARFHPLWPTSASDRIHWILETHAKAAPLQLNS
jgi:hypothetical protein